MHLQAIVTKYHGPTNSLGSRISAKASAGKVTVAYDQGLGIQENHARAARALAEKMGWGGHWVSGGMPEGTGDVFVCIAGPHVPVHHRNKALYEAAPAFSTMQREA